MEKTKKIHLISNAHLDPVWLWRWDEGAAEALSTFRVAADFCEQYDGYVFNHNEALLYEWTKLYEPELFARIKRLVKAGKWHIMGGWYLQPDCNMPYGEGMIRQIARGRRWFFREFGVFPRVAVNVDSFGHSRGLVQLLKKSGYEGYLFCRPLREFLGNVIDEWGHDEFIWQGYDGSEVLGHRHFAIYNSPFGKADKKLEYYLKERGDKELGLLLWGIGNHGGGPSRVDLEQMNQAIAGLQEQYELVHSTPEAFFAELEQSRSALPVRCRDLNPWAVGGYTTQAEVKRTFRKLESELFMTEKMAAMAWQCGGMEYPAAQLEEAEETLLFAQFHDIIPGTLVPSAMEESLNHIRKGLDLLGQIKVQAFFALCRGQQRAPEGAIPLLAFNPHPYPVEGIFECEFHMNQTFSRKRFLVAPHLYRNGQEIPCQLEQEESQMPMQWRRKVSFRAVLEPMQISRFDCRMVTEEMKSLPQLTAVNGCYAFENNRIRVIINTATGLLDSYRVDGKEYLAGQAFEPLVIADDDHSIGTFVTSFRALHGRFRLMDTAAAGVFSGIFGELAGPVRIVEDGPIRTVVEAALSWNHSAVCMKYYLPREGTEVEVEVIVHWNETSSMLKLSIPCAFHQPEYLGQVMYGYDNLPDNGLEAVAQRWTAVRGEGRMLSVLNDRIYGSSLEGNEMRLTLLRSPRYGCLSRADDRYALYNSGYVEHTDQGVHRFRFRLNGGAAGERLRCLEREALNWHEAPYLVSFFPGGTGGLPSPFIRLEAVQTVITALKKAAGSDALVIRLYNAGTAAEAVLLRLLFAGREETVRMAPFEVKTLVFNPDDHSLTETDLLEGWYDD